MEITLSVPFGYEQSEEIRKLLEDFRDMLNFCIERALKDNITSYARLRKHIYREWKSRWDYSTHFCHSACAVATSILKSWRRLKRKGMTRSDRLVARKLFIRQRKHNLYFVLFFLSRLVRFLLLAVDGI
ncbi:MAG: hypothetical protein QXF23_00775 [Candidatus Bathyarchaeia archaeon]